MRNLLTRKNARVEVNNGGMSAVIPDVYEKFPQFDGMMLRRNEITVRAPEQIKSSMNNRWTCDGGEDALELRIPMSSFGENQRLRATSERQDRSSDYPGTAASSPSEDIMPQEGRVVKHEELISYKNDSFSASMERK